MLLRACGFPRPLQVNSGIVHENKPFKVIIYKSSYYSMLHSLCSCKNWCKIKKDQSYGTCNEEVESSVIII